MEENNILSEIIDNIESSEIAKCPYCDRYPKTNEIFKSWIYNSIKVSRYQCTCGKKFNFFIAKNSSWTIPKNAYTKLGKKKKNVK